MPKPFEATDAFEAFLLDFMLYRRNKKSASAPAIPHGPDAPVFPAEMGKGWPHYKALSLPAPGKTPPTPHADNAPQTEIIGFLTPIVTEILTRFGKPDTPDARTHLRHQVVARAMAMPLIAESMRAEENCPWGRVPLLHAVVELLLGVC